MITQHLTFKRNVGKFTILVSVVDEESVKELPNESFLLSTTSSSFLTGMQPSTVISKQVFTAGREVKGFGIDGILTSPHWFVRRIENPLGDLLG